MKRGEDNMEASSGLGIGGAMRELFDSLRSAGQGFTGAVSSFGEVRKELDAAGKRIEKALDRAKSMEQSLDSLLVKMGGGKLPERMTMDPELEEVLDPSLTDEGFLERLNEVLEGGSTLSRMDGLRKITEAHLTAIEDFRRKEGKLAERMRLGEKHTPEWTVAAKRQAMVRKTIAVLEKRVETMIDRWFKYRRRLMQGVTGQTEMLEKALRQHGGRTLDSIVDVGAERRFMEDVMEKSDSLLDVGKGVL